MDSTSTSEAGTIQPARTNTHRGQPMSRFTPDITQAEAEALAHYHWVLSNPKRLLVLMVYAKTSESGCLSFTEVAEQTGLAVSSARYYANQLEERGYLEGIGLSLHGDGNRVYWIRTQKLVLLAKRIKQEKKVISGTAE